MAIAVRRVVCWDDRRCTRLVTRLTEATMGIPRHRRPGLLALGSEGAARQCDGVWAKSHALKHVAARSRCRGKMLDTRSPSYAPPNGLSGRKWESDTGSTINTSREHFGGKSRAPAAKLGHIWRQLAKPGPNRANLVGRIWRPALGNYSKIPRESCSIVSTIIQPLLEVRDFGGGCAFRRHDA